jgi:uncharacterized secreted protein with C-terminal beta-propeller domain
MRRRLTTLALATSTGTLAVAMLASPLLGDSGRHTSPVHPSLAPAAADLPPFSSCPELRQWYVDAALPKVGPWGFGYPFVYAMDNAVAAAPLASSVKAVGSSATGTNVQQAGVDEPDTAKTDGSVVVDARGHDLVVTDVTGTSPRVLSRLRLPDRAYGHQILLAGHTVIAFGTVGSRWGGGPVPLGGPMIPDGFGFGTPSGGRTRVFTVDIADPSHPRITENQSVGGTLVSARLYADGTVRAVYETGYPQLHFVHPTRHRSAREATRENRQIVRQASIDAWLPTIRNNASLRTRILDCDKVLHPTQPSGFGTLSVMTFPASTPTHYTATAITAAGDLVYSSTDRLYVATTGSQFWYPMAAGRKAMNRQPTTQIDAFAVDGASTTYVASGTVPGSVKDRWSFSEYDGHLRVVTGLGRDWSPRENGVFVLDENGEHLDVVGRLTGLGRDQRVQSVRWFGNLGVVTTFRQIDPLYTLDLSEPTKPRVLGALHISGYSGYLHPVADGILLGLGHAVGSRAASEPDGAAAATFNLTDPNHVTRTDTLDYAHNSSFGTDNDPLTFTYLPDLHVALVPLESWNGRTAARLVAMRVGDDGSLTRLTSYSLGRWYAASARTLPLGGNRVAVVDHGVRIIDVP